MSSSLETGTEYHCHSKFVYNHGQKPSLTRVTNSKISSTLYRLYPLLIIVDGALSNVMWICDDICLPFIYVVMISLFVNMLSLTDPSQSFKTTNCGMILTLWLGMMAGISLLLSFSFYVVTVYQDLEQYEPPTLDDIVIVLESVVDKLDTMRREGLHHMLKMKTWLDTINLALILTPVQFVSMKCFSIRDYTLLIVISCMLYHSNWFQSTIRLFWRVLATRKLYFMAKSMFDNQNIIYAPLIDGKTANEKTNATIFLPFPKTPSKLGGNKLQLELLRLHPLGKEIDNVHKISTSDTCIAINEFIIHENQRKWKPYNTWQPKLLSYEAPKFCMQLNECLHACKSPWEFQESLPTDWEWLDDCWRPSGWKYFDSCWKSTGSNDSLEAYTRTKVWRRRAFKVFK